MIGLQRRQANGLNEAINRSYGLYYPREILFQEVINGCPD